MADDQHLQQARSELEGAAETADDDVRDALRETAGAFAELAAADREADHAVLDGHLNTLRQAREQSDADTANSIDRALEHAETYREDLEQA
ncbi:DUF7553 family protein [Natrononativus amylolyticus]|uniref:DUF7553 family protein n=1 Tax=Natrononativus amylolyticus TaxID=2963434 RepID=UPI0020CD71D0|nr:hypothetical protein [Natrononativus amylolyticus]